MALQRVLFIAPSDSGLDIAPEIESLYDYNYYQVQTVPSPVTRKRLFDTVRRREFDIMHFACHANEDGVILSAGEELDIAGMIQLARSCNAILVFINACESAAIGQALVDEGVPAAIVTLNSVPDTTAKETAQLFYKELARTDNIRIAYTNSKPSIRGGYIMLSNGKLQELQFAPVLDKLDELQKLFTENELQHARFDDTFKNIASIFDDINKRLITIDDIKKWFLIVLIPTIIIITLIQIAMVFITRA